MVTSTDKFSAYAVKPCGLFRLLVLAKSDSAAGNYRFRPIKCVAVSQKYFQKYLPSRSELTSAAHFNNLEVEFWARGIDKVRHFHIRDALCNWCSIPRLPGLHNYKAHPITASDSPSSSDHEIELTFLKFISSYQWD